MTSSRSKWARLGIYFEVGFRGFLSILIGAYRTMGTTHLGGICRFEPSCSKFANEAVALHPPFKACKLILRRFLNCRPGGPFGFDPVPSPTEKT